MTRTTIRLALVLVLVLVVALPAVGSEKRTSTGQLDVWDPAGVEDFEMLDQTGQRVTRADLQGRPWLACFIFTRCPLSCPRLTVEMEKLRDEYGHTDLRFVSFSVDPQHDTPEVLAAYAKKVNADPAQWKFLTTPDKGTLYGVVHGSFKVPLQERDEPDIKPEFRIIHSDLLMYVDARGRVQGKFNGLDDKDMASLRRFLDTQGIVGRLPLVNASLNALATVLLLLGWWQIRRRQAGAHKRTMLAAFAVSILFLASYLTYHYFAGSKPYGGTGFARTAYFGILISHIVLAASVPALAVVTIWLGLRAERTGNWPLHKRWAWITFPIWLYVSVTGVVIYLMLYQSQWFS